MDTNTCWFKENLITEEMNRNYPVYLNLINETFHIKSLQSILHFVSVIENYNKLKAIDLGCGTAQISILFNKDCFEYEGADLPHIINDCACKWHPQYNYSWFNAIGSNFLFLKEYDLVLCNAFIDVMPNPLEILNKILENALKYVIIHRQEISDTKQTHTIKMPSYGDFTYHSIISRSDFNNIISKHNFTIIKHKTCGFSNWENNGESFLLQKNPI